MLGNKLLAQGEDTLASPGTNCTLFESPLTDARRYCQEYLCRGEARDTITQMLAWKRWWLSCCHVTGLVSVDHKLATPSTRQVSTILQTDEPCRPIHSTWGWNATISAPKTLSYLKSLKTRTLCNKILCNSLIQNKEAGFFFVWPNCNREFKASPYVEVIRPHRLKRILPKQPSHWQI